MTGLAETAAAGPLLVAVGLSVLAGLVSFASPCVVPLVPGYLSYLAAVVGVDGTDGTRKRNARDGQGCRSGNNRTRTRIVDHVNRKGRDDDLDFIEVALGEEWAQRSVGQTRRQNRGGRGTTFALEEAARDFTSSVHLLFVIDGQWEKVDPLAGRFGGHNGGQQDGVPVAYGDGTVGLLGEPTRFEGHGPTGDFSADAVYFAFCHGLLLLCHRVWQLPCVRYWRLPSALRTPSSNP